MSPTSVGANTGVTLNPPERKQRLSGDRVAEIGQAAAAMPHDVPFAGWLGDLCADLFDARAMLDARDAEIARMKRYVESADADEAKAKDLARSEAELRFKAEAENARLREESAHRLKHWDRNVARVAQLEAALRTYLAAIDSMTHDGVPPDAAVVARRELRALLDTR